MEAVLSKPPAAARSPAVQSFLPPLARHVAAICLFLAAGGVTSLAFPATSQPLAAWIGLLAFAGAALLSPRYDTAIVGAYLGGLLFQILVLTWMFTSSSPHGIALCHYLAIAWAIAAVLFRWLHGRKIPALLALPLAWTVATAIPSGLLVLVYGPPGNFELNRLATTQLPFSLSQTADLAGMAGIEFLMCFVVGGLLDLASLLRAQSYRRAAGLSAVLAVVLAGAWCYGKFRLSQPGGDETITVALYNTLLPELESDGTPREDLRAPPEVDLFVWPEIAFRDRWLVSNTGAREIPARYAQQFTTPAELEQYAGHMASQWRGFAKHLQGGVMSGVRRHEIFDQGTRTFNSVLYSDAADGSYEYVDKRCLVMGPESPSPVDWVVEAPAGARYEIGVASRPFTLIKGDSKPISLTVPICYEITVPGAIRAVLSSGSAGRPCELIVNPGCETRVKDSTAPSIMLSHARLRAIEFRRCVVRATFDGQTASIDGNGTVKALLPPDGEAKNGPLVDQLALDRRFSPYSAFGDWLVILSVVVTGTAILRGMRPRVPAENPPASR